MFSTSSGLTFAALCCGHRKRQAPVFLFFSSRLGCLASMVVSLALSALLVVLARGCSTGSSFFEVTSGNEAGVGVRVSRAAPSQSGGYRDEGLSRTH
jgi:hypothetical protein